MPMPLNDLIELIYRVRYGNPDRLYQVRTNFTPEDMIVKYDPKSAGRIQWRLIRRSDGIDPGFSDFEREIGCALPESFKLWHSRYYTLNGDIGFVRFRSIPSNDPFGPLRKEMTGKGLYLPDTIVERGFVGFASA